MAPYPYDLSESQPSAGSAMQSQASDPRFPIGRFQRPEAGQPLPPHERGSAIAHLAELPEQLRNAVEGLDEDQLNTSYREGGWTVRQLVHHVADSHMNAFVRVRLALTEDNPLISDYNQDAWSALHDSLVAPVEWSLELVEALHGRWVMLLQSLSDSQFQRTFKHPARGPMSVESATLLYAWHGRHHVAHITHLRAADGW